MPHATRESLLRGEVTHALDILASPEPDLAAVEVSIKVLWSYLENLLREGRG